MGGYKITDKQQHSTIMLGEELVQSITRISLKFLSKTWSHEINSACLQNKFFHQHPFLIFRRRVGTLEHVVMLQGHPALQTFKGPQLSKLMRNKPYAMEAYLHFAHWEHFLAHSVRSGSLLLMTL